MLILDIIKKYNLFTKKKFGQNFLVDELLLDKIVACSGLIQNKNVLEIGCGPGGLTYSILKQNPKKLISVEIDKDCYNIVKTEFEKYKNFEVINQDATKINEQDLFNGEKIKIIANLPYNVGTNLLIKWLHNLSIFEDFALLDFFFAFLEFFFLVFDLLFVFFEEEVFTVFFFEDEST